MEDSSDYNLNKSVLFFLRKFANNNTGFVIIIVLQNCNHPQACEC